MKPIILFSMFTTLAVTCGCDQAEPVAATPAAVTATAAPTTRGQVEMCLLCEGHEIRVTPDTLKAEYDGQTYYFCSKSCKKAFVKDPAKYVNPGTTQPTPAAHDHGHQHD